MGHNLSFSTKEAAMTESLYYFTFTDTNSKIKYSTWKCLKISNNDTDNRTLWLYIALRNIELNNDNRIQDKSVLHQWKI